MNEVLSKAERTRQIRKLNDRFRKHIPVITHVPGRVMLTSGIQDIASTDRFPNIHLGELFQVIRDYDSFDGDSDPHGEHDFGAFDFKGHKCFWKVEYYALDLVHGSEDPSDITRTLRVLTVMRADEY